MLLCPTKLCIREGSIHWPWMCTCKHVQQWQGAKPRTSPTPKNVFWGERSGKKNTFTVFQEFDSPGPPLNTLFDRWVYVKCRIHGSGYPTPPGPLFWGDGLIHFTGLVFPGSPGMFNFFSGEYPSLKNVF